MESERPAVFVLSDSLGETAELVVRAAAAQFNAGGVDVRKYGYVQSEEAIDTILDQAQRRKSIVAYTLVKPELREYARVQAGIRGILSVDVLGPMLDALATVAPSEPRFEPGLKHRLDEEYFRRVEAVEFSVKADDGKDILSLPFADVVLIGVSRTSKTPVSLYLAQRVYKVANVPLVPEIPPPAELFKIPAERVIGLTLSPEKLVKIRKERLRAMGLDENSSYADLTRILQELDYANKIFRELGCSVIDVTDKAVEETANEVLEIIKGRSMKSGR